MVVVGLDCLHCAPLRVCLRPVVLLGVLPRVLVVVEMAPTYLDAYPVASFPGAVVVALTGRVAPALALPD